MTHYNVLSNSEFDRVSEPYQLGTYKQFSGNINYLQNRSMGSLGGLLGDLLDAVLGFLKHLYEALEGFAKDVASAVESAVRHVVDSVIDFVKASFNFLVAIASFDWEKIKDAFSEFGYALGNMLVQLSPVRFAFDLIDEIPLLGNIQREIDRFSGGFLTTSTNLTTLFGRAVRGDSISKQELMTYAILGVQVGAIILSGGAASGYIGIISNQLRMGTLGRTEFGNQLLGALAIAGTAYAAGSGVLNATQQYAIDTAKGEGIAFASKELGVSSDLEVFLFQGALMAGGAAYKGDNMGDVLKDYSYMQAKSAANEEVSEELSRHLPKEIASKLTPHIMDSAENTDLTQISLTRFPKDAFGSDYSFDDFLNDMVEGGAKITSSVVDAAGKITDVKLEYPDMEKFQKFVNEESNRVYKEVLRTPENLEKGMKGALKEGQRGLENLKDAVLNAEVDASLRPLDLDIKIPDIKSPDISLDADFEDLWTAWKKYNEYFNGKKAMYRRNYGGYVIYLLEDGTYYYIKQTNWQAYMLAAIAAGSAVALS